MCPQLFPNIFYTNLTNIPSSTSKQSARAKRPSMSSSGGARPRSRAPTAPRRSSIRWAPSTRTSPSRPTYSTNYRRRFARWTVSALIDLCIRLRCFPDDIMVEEAALGDFKRTSARELMSLKFGGLMECCEKGCVVAEIGRSIVSVSFPFCPVLLYPRLFLSSPHRKSRKNLHPRASRAQCIWGASARNNVSPMRSVA